VPEEQIDANFVSRKCGGKQQSGTRMPRTGATTSESIGSTEWKRIAEKLMKMCFSSDRAATFPIDSRSETSFTPLSADCLAAILCSQGDP
jgi:hypothetical protein